MRMSARTVNSFVKIFIQLNEKAVSHSVRGFQPREMIGARAQLLRRQHAQLCVHVRQLRQQRLHRSGRRQPVVFHQHRLRAAVHARHLRIEILLHADRGVVVVQAHARPVGDQSACFGATKAKSAPVQHALALCDQRQEAVDQRQQPAAWWRKTAPERRAAGRQPQPVEVLRIAPGVHAGQLTAEAVAADDPGQGAAFVIGGGQDRLAARQILFKYFAVTPVLRARWAQRTAAIAAPLMQVYRHAPGCQRQCQWQVMACSHAQRRQPQQARDRLRRHAGNHLVAVAVVALHGEVARRQVHACGAAPK
ncbi:hypothetical protein ABB31_06405 [Stenotrophomonas pavanii]|nr:hypothetical protein ABB31_06405 [Stenotrophomonas pavanii]